MKTKSILIAALIMVGSVSAMAEKPETATGLAVVPVKGSNVYKVIYKGDNEGKVKVNLYNNEAQVVFTQTMANSGFILPLNFSNLSSGEYTVELVDANGKKAQKFVHGIATTPANYIHVSKIASEEGKYLISVRNANAINVKIYDRSGLIFDESKTLAGDFAQVYAVKVPGELTFEITDANGNVKTARF